MWSRIKSLFSTNNGETAPLLINEAPRPSSSRISFPGEPTVLVTSAPPVERRYSKYAGGLLALSVASQAIKLFSVTANFSKVFRDAFGHDHSNENDDTSDNASIFTSETGDYDPYVVLAWSLAGVIGAFSVASLAYASYVIGKNHLTEREQYKGINPCVDTTRKVLQQLSIPGTFVGHVSGISSQLAMVMNNVNNLDRSTLLILHSSFIVFGAIGSYAPTKRHQHALKIYNGEVSPETKQQIEKLDLCNLLALTTAFLGQLAPFLGVAAWIGDIIDESTEASPIFLGYSPVALGVGISLSVLLKILATVAHNFIDRNHIDGSVTENEIRDAEKEKLTAFQKLIVSSHTVVDGAEVAAEIKYATLAAMNGNTLPKGISLGTSAASFFAGLIASVGEALTTTRSIQIYNLRVREGRLAV